MVGWWWVTNGCCWIRLAGWQGRRPWKQTVDLGVRCVVLVARVLFAARVKSGSSCLLLSIECVVVFVWNIRYLFNFHLYFIWFSLYILLASECDLCHCCICSLVMICWQCHCYFHVLLLGTWKFLNCSVWFLTIRFIQLLAFNRPGVQDRAQYSHLGRLVVVFPVYLSIFCTLLVIIAST